MKAQPDQGLLDVVCFGGAAADRTFRTKVPVVLGTSNPSTGQMSFGGVARNIAENLARLERHVGLVSLVGEDEAGSALLAHASSLGVDVSHSAVRADLATAQYLAVLEPDGNLHLGLAAMDAFEAMTPAMLRDAMPLFERARWVFADTNLPAATLAALLIVARRSAFKLAVDSVSVAKAVRLPQDLSGLDVLFTNLDEARALIGYPDGAPEVLAQSLMARGAGHVVLTLGAQGHLVARPQTSERLAALPTMVSNVTGAGDALIAGTLHGLLQDLPMAEASRMGAVLASLTLRAPTSVLTDLTPSILSDAYERLLRP